MKKKITIDELALMIKRGFDETAKKVDVDRRFEEVESRLDDIENRMETVENGMVTKADIRELETQIALIQRMPDALDRRVDRMEDDIRLIKTKVGMR